MSDHLSQHAAFNLAAWNQLIHQDIPATLMLGIRLTQLTPHCAAAWAPLAQNINGHGTGFAGSIYTLGVVTGWTLISALAKTISSNCQVVAGEAHIHYRQPLSGNLVARAELNGTPCASWHSQWQSYRAAKQPLTIMLGTQDSLTAAEMTATFYIKKEESN